VRQSIKWYLEINLALSKDDRAILERLLADDRAEKVWSIIRAHAERHGGSLDGDAPMLMLIHILEVKAAAERESKANADLAAMAAEIKRLETDITRKIGRKVRRVPFKEISGFLRRAGELLGGSPSAAAISPPRVRSDRDGSRARSYFMRDMSDFVHDVTGYRLDEQVGVITEAVFDTDDSISADAVRKARSK
jgi:hypothetical protein